ncbi:MAG TPA: TIGR03557 family F420-dependent LLM class oxidoreductase, partial [Nocardioidaceae bacterium]
ILRYHPAVVAQKAATIGILSDNRFMLGLGAGENLNEHVVGQGWPPVNVRHEMLEEATLIIKALLDGGYVNFKGAHYRVDSAKLWDLPEERVEIGVAVSGEQSIQTFGPVADHLVAVEPSRSIVEQWDAAHGAESRKLGQLPVCWDTDRDRAIRTAHEQFRWFGGGWKVNAELPGPAGFAGATQFVRPEDVAESIPCGPDIDAIVAAVRQFEDAGFTDVALVQIGDERQEEFLQVAEKEILPALRG